MQENRLSFAAADHPRPPGAAAAPVRALPAARRPRPPTSFALTLPADPNRIGLQLTAPARATSGSGTPVTGLSRPSWLDVR
ncbi:MAG: hypothetical protein JNN13_06825 [Planctomycetes bacterium]|nr:hypothetical protein [Planctomycetota bacterium]